MELRLTSTESDEAVASVLTRLVGAFRAGGRVWHEDFEDRVEAVYPGISNLFKSIMHSSTQTVTWLFMVQPQVDVQARNALSSVRSTRSMAAAISRIAPRDVSRGVVRALTPVVANLEHIASFSGRVVTGAPVDFDGIDISCGGVVLDVDGLQLFQSWLIRRVDGLMASFTKPEQS